MQALLTVLALPFILQPPLGGDSCSFDASNLDGSAIKVCENADQQVGYVVDEIGGRTCVRTDRANGLHWLVFDVPDDFAYDEVTPLTLAVTYFDQPAGLLEVRYDAQDDKAGVQYGPIGRITRFMRSGWMAWQTATYSLPNPKLANRSMTVGDLAVMAHTWTSDPRAGEVAIAGITLSRSCLNVTSETDTVASGMADAGVMIEADCRVGVLKRPPDGEEVRLVDVAGTMLVTVPTTKGKASAAFVPPNVPGWSQVEATWGGITASTWVYTLEGPGPVRDVEFNIDAFDAERPLQVSQVLADATTWTWDNQIMAAGTGALRVDYVFDAEPAPNACLQMDIGKELPGRTMRILWDMYGDASGHWIQVVLQDHSGKILVYEVDRIMVEGWQEVVCDLTAMPPSEITGGDGSPLLDFPVTLQSIKIVRWRPGVADQGSLRFDSLRADCKVAAPG